MSAEDVDDTIHCMYTLSDYTEDVLGYGISYDDQQRKFSIADELISHEAFFENNVRKSAVLKVPFSYWFPAFINLKHTSQSDLDSLLASHASNPSNTSNTSNTGSSHSSDSSNSSDSAEASDTSDTSGTAALIASNLHKTKWYKCLKESIAQLSDVLGPRYMNSQECVYQSVEETRVIKIMCKLINDMLVDLMAGEQHASLVYFEAVCSFWRTLYWYVHESHYSQFESKNAKIAKIDSKTTRTNTLSGSKKELDLEGMGLLERLQKRLNDFVLYEESRHKDNEPDLGHVFIMYTILSDVVGKGGNISVDQVVDGYVFEANIRCVRWWRQKGIEVDDVQSVFKNRNVGRNLFVFQRLFLIDVVGMGRGKYNAHKEAFFKKYAQKSDAAETESNADDVMRHLPGMGQLATDSNEASAASQNVQKDGKKNETDAGEDAKEDAKEAKDEKEKECKSDETEEIIGEVSSRMTARRMDETNGKLGKYLELIQNDFKRAKQTIDGYVKFWEFVGVSDVFLKFHRDERELKDWIALGLKLAKSKGPRYYPKRLQFNDQNGGHMNYNQNNSNRNARHPSGRNPNARNRRREDYFIEDVYDNQRANDGYDEYRNNYGGRGGRAGGRNDSYQNDNYSGYGRNAQSYNYNNYNNYNAQYQNNNNNNNNYNRRHRNTDRIDRNNAYNGYNASDRYQGRYDDRNDRYDGYNGYNGYNARTGYFHTDYSNYDSYNSNYSGNSSRRRNDRW